MRHTQAPAGGASEPAHGGSKRYVSRHLERYRQIAEVLSRHGLGFIVGVVGLSRWVPFHRGVLGHERRQEPYTTPEHLRLAIEELGPTFIKLGQLLSTRSDIVPADYLHELSKLQDAARPVTATHPRRWSSRNSARPDELFASFDTEPVASASIGQAHLATLPDGTEVVVKVRRPRSTPVIETDLEILQNLANSRAAAGRPPRTTTLPGLVSEFALTLRRELDYLSEGRNAERFAVNFAADQDVHIPRVFWATTTSRVLTLEGSPGPRWTTWPASTALGSTAAALATKAAGVALSMVFEHGFFHADPHPGNLFIEPDGRIGLIDFGMVGEVDDGAPASAGDGAGRPDQP